MQEGLTPINQNNRSVGGVAGRISPWEGVAKLGQVLGGEVSQHYANKQLADALQPPDNPSGQQQPQTGSGSVWINADGSPSRLATMEALQGNRTVPQMVEMALKERQGLISNPLVNTTINGQEGLYPTSAALNAAAGQQPQQAPPKINPMSGGPMMAPTVPAQGAGPQAPGAGAGGGTGMPPPVPVQGPQGLPPIGAGQVPPVNASALQAPPAQPQPASSVPPPPSPGISLPGPNPNAPPQMPQLQGLAVPSTPAYGKTVLSPQQQAQLDLQKEVAIAQAKAPIAVAQAGATKQAEATGEGLGKAQVGAATIDSRFDNAQQLLSQANDSAKDASYGIATGWKEDIHNQLNDKTSIANADYQNKMSQVLTQAIPGIVQATGGRIDIPLLNAIKAAENADISLSPSAKQKVIQDLSDALDQQRQNMHNQVTNLGGSAPATPLLRFGQTATNPQTGHQMTYMFGKWQ